MGNLCSPNFKCPLHSENKIDNICVHPRCIEPLCPECLPNHHEKHKAIGTPPIFKLIGTIKDSLSDSVQLQAVIYQNNSQFSQPVRRLSTPETIKQYTREYFLKRRPALGKSKDIHIADLLSNIEMAQKLTLSQTQQKVKLFLRAHLEANDAVISEEYRQFYQKQK